MTDRELLELAAKAAGLHIDDWNCDIAVMYFWDGDPQNPERNHYYWSPLTDDGDALRLAVKLDIEIYQGDDEGPAVFAGYWGKPERRDVARLYCIEPLADDPCAATCRAIVRAAAEIGRRMQHE